MTLVNRVAGLAALAVACAFALDLLTYKGVGHDLAAYLLAARRLLAGEPLYPDPASLVPGPFGLFLYPPVTALPFLPLARLSFDEARLSWFLLEAALAAGLLAWLARPHGAAARPWILAGAILFFPLLWEVQLGNLTLATLLCCLWAWRLRDSAARAGILLALALLVKLLPVAILFFFVASGRWRAVAAAGAAVAATLVLSWPWLGAAWVDYVVVLRTVALGPAGEGTNIAPAAFAATPLRWVPPATAVAVACGAGLAVRGRPALADRAFRLALAGVPLVSGTLWYPYLVFALPLLFAVPRDRLFGAARVVAWLLLELQLFADRGRDFTLPFWGLAFLLAAAAAELALEIRARRAVEVTAPVAAASGA